MLFNPPVITKELHNLKSLCERCGRNPINVYTTAGKKERELLIQEIQQECDIKCNTKINRYTLIPRMSKEEIKEYKKQLKDNENAQKKIEEQKMVFIPEEQQYIDIADNKVFSSSGFDNLIIYYAYHGTYETKRQFITALFHNLEFYKIYNKYSQELQLLLQKYPISLVKSAEEFISESLYRTISDTLKRLNNSHKLDMEEYYMVNGMSVPAYELTPVIKKACKKLKCSSERQAIKLFGQEYYTIRDKELQAFILKKSENLHRLIEDDSVENITEYTVDYKHIKFHSETKYNINLTKEQQEELLIKFISRWRERLRYRITTEKKKSTPKSRNEVYVNHAPEYFSVFEPLLKISSNGYHTPEEYKERELHWNYNTNIDWKNVGTVLN